MIDNLQKQLSLLAAPVTGQRVKIEFERNNFFNIGSIKPGKKQEVSTPANFVHGERLSPLTLPSILLSQVIHSSGVTVDREKLFTYLQARAEQYKKDLRANGPLVEELVVETLPRNALLNQTFEAAADFLGEHYGEIYDHLIQRSHQFGQYIVAKTVLAEAHNTAAA